MSPSSHDIPDSVTPPTKVSWFERLKGKFVVLLILVLGAGYFIYYSSAYPETFSNRIGGGSGEGFYIVTYPTHQGVFYYRPCQDSLCLSETFKTESVFIDGANAETFQPLGRLYAMDKNSLYYVAWSSSYSSRHVVKVPDVDVKSVSLVDEYYVKDSASVFYRDTKLPGADSADFKFLDKAPVLTRSDGSYRYVLSAGKIYYGSEVVRAVRDGTFIVSVRHQHIPCKNRHSLEEEGYDQCDLTESGKDIEVPIDVSTFEIIDHESASMRTYAKDSSHVYYMDNFDCMDEQCSQLHIVEDADPATFRVEQVRGWYDAVDSDAVYKDGCRLYGVSASNPSGAALRGEEDKYSVQRWGTHYLEQGRCAYLSF
ncbi:MAG TPA: DKNYY domain-containing protein [Candidatus Paceibacterota bacterium]|nr:DKNYY domain-containing protein [Candidatus Paceibacterota bacterium]